MESKGPALWIILNRPECKNAFNLNLARELLSALKMGIQDKRYSVIVLTGAGNTFSAGGDIKLMSETKQPKGFFLEISRLVHNTVKEIQNTEKPVLACIPGYVGGIAFGAILGCDLRIASSTAQFNAATIRIGLVANGGATYYLPRLLGLGKATEILFLGDIVSAEEALRIGLVNKMVEPTLLESETQKIAERLAASPRKALGRLKKILNASLTSPLSIQMERERQAIAWSSTTSDFQEGISAFLEKRKPVFNI